MLPRCKLSKDTRISLKKIPFQKQRKKSTAALTPQQSVFSVNKCYMFITILKVLTDQTQTKIIKHTHYIAFINNKLPNFQKSEQPIARTAKKTNQTLLLLENKANKIFFQNTRTPDSDWSQTNHLDRKSVTATIMKSLWKLTLVLWVQDNFADWQQL